jgi:hypothetical protein
MSNNDRFHCAKRTAGLALLCRPEGLLLVLHSVENRMIDAMCSVQDEKP